MRKHRILPLVTAASLAIAATSPATAKMASQTVPSGRTTLISKYGYINRDCSSGTGIVKVLTKPQHGTLSRHREPLVMNRSRYGALTKCHGTTINGFFVYYTSAAAFHGADSFSIEVSYPTHAPEIDTYSVTVE